MRIMFTELWLKHSDQKYFAVWYYPFLLMFLSKDCIYRMFTRSHRLDGISNSRSDWSRARTNSGLTQVGWHKVKIMAFLRQTQCYKTPDTLNLVKNLYSWLISTLSPIVGPISTFYRIEIDVRIDEFSSVWHRQFSFLTFSVPTIYDWNDTQKSSKHPIFWYCEAKLFYFQL